MANFFGGFTKRQLSATFEKEWPAWERNSEFLHIWGRYPSLLPDPNGFGYLAVEAEFREEAFTAKIINDYTKSEGAAPVARAHEIPPMPAMAYSRGKSPRQRTDYEALPQTTSTLPQDDQIREEARIAESRPMGNGNGGTDSPRSGPKRQDFSNEKVSKRDIRLGEYILGQTVGEGEFGKVKMGWKKEGGAQVAIKLIRREKLDSKARLDKVYREIAILRDLDHPNIVRLHEMVETERTIGIILEYASGGELFDYILHERYLKDNAARRLFAQLVSGVGYLHKKGIIHRDLKLENLLLDRNRNIIITDFGFANTFDPNDELGEKVESNLHRRSFVKRYNLERVSDNGYRRGDLMSTSCGSPCYAAPELVVSDSLYTGRKVDVWSCGVILYAMLAGYLPFDDDPANPDGDNINLLYKYIVTAPLVFPEHVTPHARDLLRRILVPDPRHRADLFEVARHSWLNDYAHVVEFITSGTTSPSDVAKATVNSDGEYGLTPSLARSASLREATKALTSQSPVGGLMSKHGKVNLSPDVERKQTPREQKRRTVQIEYVAPQSQTIRGGGRDTATSYSNTSKSESPRIKGGSQIPRKPAPSSTKNMPPPARPGREVPRSVSDSTAFTMSPPTTSNRPLTSGAMTPTSRLPQRGSYGQPSAAAVANTTAQGRFSQPPPPSRSKRNSVDSGIPPTTGGRTSQEMEASQQKRQSMILPEPNQKPKRNSALSSLGGRLFGRSSSKSKMRSAEQQQGEQLWEPGHGGDWALTHEQAKGIPATPTKNRAFPPSSMRPMNTAEPSPRKSNESRRSFGFSRKSFESNNKEKRNSKRFSLIPRLGSSSGKDSHSRPQTMEATNSLTPDMDGTEDVIPRVRYEPRMRHVENDFERQNGAEYTTLPYAEGNNERNRAPSGAYTDRGSRIVSNAASHAPSEGDQIPFETPWPIYTPQQEAAVKAYRASAPPMELSREQQQELYADRQALRDAEMQKAQAERQRKESARLSKLPQPVARDDRKDTRNGKSSTTSKVMSFFRGKRHSQVV